MKQIIKTVALIAASAAVLASCAKEVEQITNDASVSGDNMVEITINASSLATKTYIDGSDVKWAASGEYLKVLQDKDGAVTNETSSEGVTTDGGATMKFGVSFTEATGTSFKYYAFYPAASLNGTPAKNATKINTPAAQTPTATSFDPAADLLIAKEVDNGSTQATNLNMQFARAVAVGKMTITNLASSDDVKKVTFSAKNGATPITLAGRTEFNLETAAPTSSYGSTVQEPAIILNYSSSIKANSSMDVFFTCYPFDLAAGDSFTVEVQTATKTYTRTVNLTGAQAISFVAGKASRFSVNMSTAAEIVNAVNLCYANLTGTEYVDAGGPSSYGNFTVSKTHGDKWETYAMKSSGSIQVKNTAGDGSASYIKLPVFVSNIKTVTVTLSTAIAEGKTLSLETTSTGNTGSVASLTTVTDQTVYNFDLTSESVTTAYLRVTGAAAKVAMVEVYAGDDTRAASATAPATVTAELNTDDPAITNKIDVSWTAAENAGGYAVTLTPSAGDPVVQNVAANVTSASFTGLSYSTSYTPSVVTIADPYLQLANSTSRAGSPVSTGAAPAIHVEDITTAGSYSITGLTVMAVNGKNLIAADATGAVLVYYNDGHSYAVNDVLNLSGSVSLYNGVWEFSDPTTTKTGTTTAAYPSPVSYDASKITAYASAPVTEYATARGVADSGARTVTVADGKVLNVYGSLASVDGRSVIINGYAFGYKSSMVNFMLVGAPAIDESVPYLTTSPANGATISWDDDKYGAGNSETITVTLNGDASGYSVSYTDSESAWTVSDDGAGTITAYPKAANSSTTDDKTLTVTITHDDNGGLTSVITLKQNKKGAAPDYSTMYTSGATMAAGSNSSSAQVVINKTNYTAIKCGTGSKKGEATVSVPSGTTKLHVHIAGWNGEGGKTVNITTSTGTVSKVNNVTATSLTTTADSGVSGSSPFTLAGTSNLSTSYYYVIDLTGIEAEATITFTANVATNNRFVIWGCNAE